MPTPKTHLGRKSRRAQIQGDRRQEEDGEEEAAEGQEEEQLEPIAGPSTAPAPPPTRTRKRRTYTPPDNCVGKRTRAATRALQDAAAGPSTSSAVSDSLTQNPEESETGSDMGKLLKIYFMNLQSLTVIDYSYLCFSWQFSQALIIFFC